MSNSLRAVVPAAISIAAAFFVVLATPLPAIADAIDDAIKLYDEGIADAKKCCVNKTVQAKLKDEYEAQTALDDLKDPWSDYIPDAKEPLRLQAKGTDDEIKTAEENLQKAKGA